VYNIFIFAGGNWLLKTLSDLPATFARLDIRIAIPPHKRANMGGITVNKVILALSFLGAMFFVFLPPAVVIAGPEETPQIDQGEKYPRVFFVQNEVLNPIFRNEIGVRDYLLHVAFGNTPALGYAENGLNVLANWRFLSEFPNEAWMLLHEAIGNLWEPGWTEGRLRLLLKHEAFHACFPVFIDEDGSADGHNPDPRSLMNENWDTNGATEYLLSDWEALLQSSRCKGRFDLAVVRIGVQKSAAYEGVKMSPAQIDQFIAEAQGDPGDDDLVSGGNAGPSVFLSLSPGWHLKLWEFEEENPRSCGCTAVWEWNQPIDMETGRLVRGRVYWFWVGQP
jgi:hypothetical protein